MTDFIKLEKRVLKFWEKERIFSKLQKKNAGKKRWSFFDGPITANNKMGVHHAWGRTLKDFYQRYKAMRGFDQRWQNGFDCQGLWVEVEVEKELGLNSKQDIEKFGLEKFAKECKKRVNKFSKIITQQSQRLGQFMDWGNSYYTYSDTNIEYIWHFLKKCHDQSWLYKDKRVLLWCNRCGTSLSQHEMADSYKDTIHKAITVKFGDLSVWTTTPWTLPANKALAVHPQGKFKHLIGKKYQGPYGPGVVVGWDGVDQKEGTGIVHIAPSCGQEDFELAKKHNLEIGDTPKSFDNNKIIKELKGRGLLKKIEDYKHRYPVCWRCKEELVFKLGAEWFIKTKDIKPKLQAAVKKINWRPQGVSARMQDWLNNMGDWNISRKRFWGLPLPFYICKKCHHTIIISSRKELRERAINKRLVDKLPELHRPWIDKIKLKCDCGEAIERIKEVGDCWLDAGIIPFSTLKYLEYKSYWKKWFPAELILEMREQIRLWFYSMLFMSVTLEGRAAYKNVLAHEKVFDEKGQPMHKSTGNAIWFDEAVEKMGADVMRWLFLRQNPKSNVLFGYNKAKDYRQILNTYWNSYKFLDYIIDSHKKPNLLDKWIMARLNQIIKQATEDIEQLSNHKAIRKLEVFIDDLSNWYIRRSRKDANKEVLQEVLDKSSRLMAPFAPFITEEVYGGFSVHLADWPRSGKIDAELIKEMAQIREICAEALSQRQHKVRQPLAKLEINKKFTKELLELIKEEVNVKEIIIGDKIELDNNLTDELIQEGQDRDLIRKIQLERKRMGLKPEDKIILHYPQTVSDLVKQEINAEKIEKGKFAIIY